MAERLELWGGPECTLNRVGDSFADQFALSGHDERAEDIDLIASLGVKAVRYPILWERVAPDAPDRTDWAWYDDRLARLRDHGIEVIAGLVHHGSGPRYTSLLDDAEFATGLARHAGEAAARYPWIRRWTPVNEPLTTARFAALYGHWYPHARSEAEFWRALLNQIDGVRLAMAAIRQVTPGAELIQTDDLGRSFATVPLAEQAGFDNLRRWAGWDLLCGRVRPTHPLWAHLVELGLRAWLEAIADDPCPPDVIGLNHYLTSDRFLDHRLHRYPPHVHGGNGRRAYADVEAVRVLEPAPPGLGGAIREAWQRYRLPIALTEVHNGCTRDEQLRWLATAWDTAEQARQDGIDVRAVTGWSLFGSCGWNTLLTAPGVYEPGVFDVRGGTPRPTALAELMRTLPHGGERHPVARAAGWWERPIRLLYSSEPRPAPLERRSTEGGTADVPPLLICGASGTLGQAFARACRHRNIAYRLTDRATLDLANARQVAAVLDQERPWAVVNAAGWVRVDDAEAAPAACLAANTDGAVALARAAAERGVQTLSFSSDLVFSGDRQDGYVEDDTPAPLGVYGESKARMEAGVLALPGKHLIARTAAFFSPFDEHNFATAVARTLGAGQRFQAAADLVVSPTYVPHLVDAALDLLIDGATGIWHLTNGTALSWAAFAGRVAEALALPVDLIDPVPAASLGFAATRPSHAGLRSTLGDLLPPLEEALDGFAAVMRSAALCHAA